MPFPHPRASWIDPRSGALLPAAPLLQHMASRQAVLPGETHSIGEIHRWQLRAHRVPPEAQERGLRGTTMVQATIARDGSVVLQQVTRSSGSRMLDDAALDLFRRVSFPPLPGEFGGAEARIVVPVEFRSAMFSP